ncbi:MAG: diphthamide biosynthesis enzyme Dph2 [Candidatus Micrarchaeota archaeon]|nr:diphthamide biosynthesis enzyme Dph2 [Candidatus Micrarchaeota archaeon]
MRILLQLPEGIKPDALKYAEKYSKEGHEVIISSGPAYGACDLPLCDAKALGCDKIVHVGHTKFMDIDGIGQHTPLIEYVAVPATVDVHEIIGIAASEIKKHNYKKVGLVTNASHLHQVDEIKKILMQSGLEPVTANGSIRCNNECQILGCDITAFSSIKQKIDCAVYFGAGCFHALAPAAVEGFEMPPFLWANPYSKEIKWINDELKQVQKRRRMALAQASSASVFGILVSTKPGQFALKTAEGIKSKIESTTCTHTRTKRKAIIIAGDTFDFNTLNNFTEIQCYINTACPRIVDDQNKIKAPIINYSELDCIL